MITAHARPWLLAARPKTLVATFAPICMGAALAFRDGVFAPTNFLAALFSALFIQIGTNLANDYYDFKKGADTAERVGPIRVTQSGLIRPHVVLAGFVACFGLAAFFGLYLVLDAGLPVLIVGMLSIVCGVAYTAGPWPIAYLGLGELFVLVFFGPVASGFTYFVMSKSFEPSAFWAGLCPGALSCAILIANNLRDVEQDKKSNKRTLVVRFGKHFGRLEYAATWALAYSALVATVASRHQIALLLPLLTLPLALKLMARVARDPGPQEMIKVLEGTAKSLALFALLFCAGVML